MAGVDEETEGGCDENRERKVNNKVHFSSLRPDWKTPKNIYNKLNEEFHFNCDPCPGNPFTENIVLLEDGLLRSWGTSTFCNPPYGNAIKKWIKKGYEESLKGKQVVFLIPSRTDTIWWHEYIMKAQEIRFIKGRLKFDDSGNSAPFPSCIAIFNGY